MRVQEEILASGYTACVPTAIRLERCGGKWLERLRVLMPGYVFIDSPMDVELYHSTRAVEGVVRWLNPGEPIKLAEDELTFIRHLTPNNKPLLPLVVEGGTRLRVREGQFEGLEHKIVAADRHSRRISLCISVLGKTHTLTLSAHFDNQHYPKTVSLPQIG